MLRHFLARTIGVRRPWTVTAAARRYGVPYAAFRDWMNGLRPLPDRYWQAVDAVLCTLPDFDIPKIARNDWPPSS